MTRAQMEAARNRVARVIVDGIDVPPFQMDLRDRDALCGRIVAAVLGHPDGRAPKAARAKPTRRWPTRAQR